MCGLIDKFKPMPELRNALLAILLESVGGMPGCTSFKIVAVGGHGLMAQATTGV